MIDICLNTKECCNVLNEKQKKRTFWKGLCFQIMANADEFCQFARLGQISKIQKCLQIHSK